MHGHLFIHSTVDGHVGSFQCEVKMRQNNTSHQRYQQYFNLEKRKKGKRLSSTSSCATHLLGVLYPLPPVILTQPCGVVSLLAPMCGWEAEACLAQVTCQAHTHEYVMGNVESQEVGL